MPSMAAAVISTLTAVTRAVQARDHPRTEQSAEHRTGAYNRAEHARQRKIRSQIGMHGRPD